MITSLTCYHHLRRLNAPSNKFTDRWTHKAIVQPITPLGIKPVNFKFVASLRDSGSNKCQYVSEVFNAEVFYIVMARGLRPLAC